MPALTGSYPYIYGMSPTLFLHSVEAVDVFIHTGTCTTNKRTIYEHATLWGKGDMNFRPARSLVLLNLYRIIKSISDMVYIKL